MFREEIAALATDGKPIVYIDESGFAKDMPRTHGYAPRGERCFGTHDWNARGRTNAIGALLGAAMLTVSLFDANVNADIFHAWITQDLIPKLPPDATLVLDNASFHKRDDIKQVVKDAGHDIKFLPPYSPDLNPIEHKWAQAKAIRRNTGQSTDEIFAKFQ